MAPVGVDVTPVLVSVRVIRGQPDGLGVIPDRLVEITDLIPDEASPVVGGGIAGIETEDLVEVRYRLVEETLSQYAKALSWRAAAWAGPRRMASVKYAMAWS